MPRVLPETDEVQRFLDAWLAVRQIVQAANFNRFQRAGLSATQFMTLNVLPGPGGAMTLSELAKRLNLSPATLNKTLASLESRGLVQRTRRASDARMLDLQVTAQGTELQNAASAEFHAFMSHLFGKLEPGLRQHLLDGLEALVRGNGGGDPELAERPPAASKTTTRRAAGVPRVKRSSK